MNNLDDSEKNAKVSDSAYSTSCSNSQSRRSHSSKSTHSESNSSGSSGYGGKPDTETSEYSSSNQENRIKDKEVKKKKKMLIDIQSTGVEKENEWPLPPVLEAPKEDKDGVRPCPFALAISESATHCVDISTLDTFNGKEGGAFSCVMSLNDGIVVYAPLSITTTLGYPKEMWIGRSFIDFVHPRDRTTFAAQITNGLNMPKTNNASQVKAQPQDESICSIICRIRLFKGLTTGFGVKSRAVGFLPYLIKFFLKNIISDNGADVYLVIMAIPIFSAYNTPNEIVTHPTPFIIKHSAIGNIEHIDIDAVRYLGYLPQEILGKDVLQFYHPGDLVQIRNIYENIIQNGFAPRSKPYRMITQNGHYLILESEWSSSVNPWSKRLEFIIGKHYILEGPSNPDVFQPPDFNNVLKLSEEEIRITVALKQSIMRVMNENLTTPAQAFKQQIDKRNQDIANFVDQFMEDKPKPEEELRVDVDNCCFERDSVMLGGISPHHDNDSKSSTETPLSYNQLNYNENLERFFKSHEPYEEYDFDSGGGAWKGITMNNNDSKNLSSLEGSTIDNLSDSSGVIRISSTNEDTNDESDQFRLTKYLLQKHNADMEKELVKIHNKNRITSKSDREKALHDSLQNKMEHFARCNALYLPTNAELSSSEIQSQGVKRSSTPDAEGSANKQRCSSTRINRTQSSNLSNARSAATNTTIGEAPTWQGNTVNNANAFALGVPQPISILSPIPMQGVIPVYFGPISHPVPAGNSDTNVNTLQFQAFANTNTPYFHGTHNQPSTSTVPVTFDTAPTGAHFQMQHAIPCMMIGHAIYSSPIIYSAMEPQVYATQQNCTTQNANVHNIGLSNRNYEEATVRTSTVLTKDRTSRKTRRCENERETTRTDGESNYSSFYSSFFKTESSSTTDDCDVRNRNRNSKLFCRKKRRTDSSLSDFNTAQPNNPQPRTDNAKEQVCLTSELIYKYQIVTKNMEEVLASDKKKLQSFQQPLLVKQQLNQLQLDLQLQGVTARLTLEEGITSSSSSEAETLSKSNKVRRRKPRQYDKLVMIHEENAPLPSPDESLSSTSL